MEHVIYENRSKIPTSKTLYVKYIQRVTIMIHRLVSKFEFLSEGLSRENRSNDIMYMYEVILINVYMCGHRNKRGFGIIIKRIQVVSTNTQSISYD